MGMGYLPTQYIVDLGFPGERHACHSLAHAWRWIRYAATHYHNLPAPVIHRVAGPMAGTSFRVRKSGPTGHN